MNAGTGVTRPQPRVVRNSPNNATNRTNMANPQMEELANQVLIICPVFQTSVSLFTISIYC